METVNASVAVDVASALSKCALARANTSALLNGAVDSGVPVDASPRGVPLQNHSARYVSAMPIVSHIWPMFPAGVGAYVVRALMASRALVRARWRSRRTGVKLALLSCTERWSVS